MSRTRNHTTDTHQDEANKARRQVSVANVSRLDVIIGRLRRIGRESPRFQAEITEIVNELVHLALALGDPPASRTVRSHAPGPRQMGAKRQCAVHYGGRGALVSVSRFQPGHDICRQCESRNVKVSADTIALDLVDGDVCIGDPCPVCDEPFKAGERVVGVQIHHERCGP